MQQIIQSLVNNCGIAPQNQVNQSLLAGSSQTLLAGNLNRFYATAAEAIVQGAFVSVVNVGSVLEVRNANATGNTKPCDGFCNTPGGVLAGAVGEFILGHGLLTFPAGGNVPGTRMWLSTTNGVGVNAPVATAGDIEQYLGFIVDATHMFFNAHYWIQH
jgi:hypothetical protein